MLKINQQTKKIKTSKKQAIFMEFILYGRARPTQKD